MNRLADKMSIITTGTGRKHGVGADGAVARVAFFKERT